LEDSKQNIKKNVKKPLPVLVKAIAIFLVVYGVVGFLYYLSVFVYSFVNPAFLINLEYFDFKDEGLLFPVIMELLINIMFVISGILILKRNQQGNIIFYFTFFVSLFFSYVFLNHFNYIYCCIGLFSMFVLVYYSAQNSKKTEKKT